MDKCKSSWKVYGLGYAVVVFAILHILVMYMMVMPVRVVELHELRLAEMCTEKQTLCLELDYEKFRDLPAVATLHLHNDHIVTFPPAYSHVSVADRTTMLITTNLPDWLHDGEYHASLTLTYRVNFLRKEIYTIKTELFYIGD